MPTEIYLENYDKIVKFLVSRIRLCCQLVGSAGIEPASMNKPNPTILFMTGAIPHWMLTGGLGRN
jgi:hypothetical protein